MDLDVFKASVNRQHIVPICPDHALGNDSLSMWDYIVMHLKQINKHTHKKNITFFGASVPNVQLLFAAAFFLSSKVKWPEKYPTSYLPIFFLSHSMHTDSLTH